MAGCEPCPFCGSRHLKILTSTVAGDRWPVNVMCIDCGAHGPGGTGADQAIAIWNKRGKGKRPAAPAADVAALREKALEQARIDPTARYQLWHAGLGCQIYKKERSSFDRRGRGGGRCGAKVVAAVAYRSGYLGAAQFSFVCGVHRTHHRVDPASILAVVELPGHLLDPIRDEYARQQRAAEELRNHRRAHGLCAECGELTDPDKNEVPYCRGWHDVPDRRYLRILGPHTSTCPDDGTGYTRRCDGNCPPERPGLQLLAGGKETQ